MRRVFLAVITAIAAFSLVAVGAAGGGAAKKGKPSLSSTPVFKLRLKPNQEVPPIKNLKAVAVGTVTFDLTRNASGAITAGDVIFSFNYRFPGTVTFSGLHVHVGQKGTAPPMNIVVDSGLAPFTDADGQGNITREVPASPATLQAILDNPRNYYVNLHTTVPFHPAGALRAQMHNPKKGT